MESIRLPYDNIVAILVYLDIDDLLNSLILKRWSKTAKESVHYGLQMEKSESLMIARFAALMDFYRKLCNLGCQRSLVQPHKRNV